MLTLSYIPFIFKGIGNAYGQRTAFILGNIYENISYLISLFETIRAFTHNTFQHFV